MKVLVRRCLSGIVAFTCSFLILRADTLRLRNGQAVEGTLLEANARQVRFLANGEDVKTYSIADVSAIEFSQKQTAGKSDALVPAGSAVTVRLNDPIDSDINHAGETFQASLAEDLIVDGKTVAPRGADAIVKVVRVEQSGKLRGREEVALALDQITIDGKKYPVTSGFAQVSGESRGKESAKVVGGSAALGAIIGAIAGGGKGAAIGAAAGAGAGTTVQVLRGERLKIPAETQLTFTVTEPVTAG
jgi:hypothetical protein